MSYERPSCNGCGKKIKPFENAVSFSCPNCGDTEIWRCESCRKFSRNYTCIKCGFTGP